MTFVAIVAVATALSNVEARHYPPREVR